MMATCAEYRRRAREVLDHQLFGNTWLYMLLVLFLADLVIGVSGFVAVGPLLLTGPVMVGVASYSLHVVRRTERKNNLETAFDGFRGNVADHLLLGFLQLIFIFLWSLLFVIPGIVKSCSYAMCYYIKVDHPEYDANTCITESRKMMNGHKWHFFCLQFSFLGWVIVGCLACGVGTLWVTAYMQAAYAAFYEDLKNQPVML